MERWTDQTILWYAAAVEYTKFGRKLADILTEYLPVNETVCDLGCGIGYLALELAARGYAVTAMDREPVPLNWLRKESAWRNSHLTVLEQDWHKLAVEPRWDNVVMVCSGRTEDTGTFRRFCRKRLIVVDRLSRTSHVRADGGLSAVRLELPQDVEHNCLAHWTFSLEFGQPLTSRKEARAYITHYGGGAAEEVTLSTLQETWDPDYPFYLPHRKDMRLTVYPALGA